MHDLSKKQQAKALVVNRGLSVAAAARELGLPRRTVADWSAAGSWQKEGSELRRDVFNTETDEIEKGLEGEDTDVRATAKRVLKGINVWLGASKVVMPKEASALASALVSLSALAPSDAEDALSGVVIIPEVTDDE